MEQISLKDVDEVDLLLTELEASQGNGNLILCVVASPAYRDKIIEAIKSRFSARIQAVEKGNDLIFDLKGIHPKKDEVLVWTLPDTLSEDILNALNNFRELFYAARVPNAVFMTPAAFDDVFWKAPDFWRYRGGYHIFKGIDHGQAYHAIEALSIPMNFSYQSKEELLRRKRINEYLLEKIKSEKEKTKILEEIGIIHYLLGDARKAIKYYDQSLAIAREIGDRRGEGADLGNLGLAYAALGDARKAIDYYEQALAIDREIGDKRGEGADLGNMGNAYAALGDARQAIDYFEQHLAIAREIGDRRGEANASWNLGLAYEKAGDLRRAAEMMQICVDYEREIGHPDAENDAARLEALRAKLMS